MDQKLQKQVIDSSSDATYAAILDEFRKYTGVEPPPRLLEAPVFFSRDLKNQCIDAAMDLCRQMRGKEFIRKTESAIPDRFRTPNETTHPNFIILDFAVIEKDDGFGLGLIELQGAPSVNALALLFDDYYRKHLTIPEGQTAYPPGMTRERSEQLLRDVILGKHDPENVVLTEIVPEKQGGYIDQVATCRMLGIQEVPIDELQKKGNKLYYKRDGIDVPIHRLYNRCVLEEIDERKATLNFSFQDDLDMEWADHPNWFYRISKFTMPMLDSPYVPPCTVLSKLDAIPTDLEHYIMKPLWDKGGHGVNVNPTRADVEAVENPSNMILQRKITFATAFHSPAGPRKIEPRVMLLWLDEAEEPEIVSIKPRVFAGNLSNEHPGDVPWVGATITYFPE